MITLIHSELDMGSTADLNRRYSQEAGRAGTEMCRSAFPAASIVSADSGAGNPIDASRALGRR
jgi:hypothetical protein